MIFKVLVNRSKRAILNSKLLINSCKESNKCSKPSTQRYKESVSDSKGLSVYSK